MNKTNPFVVGRYVSDEYFCDRAEETATLLKHIENGRNVALISPRRMGKTGLILHTFQQAEMRKKYHTFFIDIYATASLTEFVYLLGKEIYSQLKSRKKKFLEQFFNIVASLRMGFKLDGNTGEPTLNISLGDIYSATTTLDEIFRYLESADLPCVVAIDEFQQIGAYEEKNVEALLRTKVQQCKNTSFIFAGSKRHVMDNMFLSPAKPFYQSAVSMSLQPIPEGIYARFVRQKFTQYNKHISDGLIKVVYAKYGGCTWFVQMMFNELFALTGTGKTCDESRFQTAQANVIASQEITYQEMLSRVPVRQKAVLQAIAKEGNVKGITSAAFIRKYNLASSSSVQAAVKGLVEKDFLTQADGAYRVYDYFFAQWLAEKF